MKHQSRHLLVALLFALGGNTQAASTLYAGDRAYATATAVTVTINSNPLKVYGAALASGSVGLYQVAIQVPSALADGDWPIQATIGGVSSPAGIVLAVHH